MGLVVLLYGLRPRSIRPLVLVTFSAFATASAYFAAMGYSSCGCFGSILLSPRYVLIMDVALISGVLFGTSHPVAKSAQMASAVHLRSRIFAGFVIATVIVASASYGVLRRPPVLAVDGSAARNATAIALAPPNWVGHTLPLLEWIECGDVLRSGTWILVFHRPDCPSCRAVRREYMAYLSVNPLADLGVRVGFLDISSRANRTRPIATVEALRDFEMKAGPEWLLATPAAIVLRNGVVASAPNEALSVLSLAAGDSERGKGVIASEFN